MSTASNFKRTASIETLRTAALVCCASAAMIFFLAAQPARGGDFTFIINTTPFQEQWDKPEFWTLNNGVDDGGNGYPDGMDTFTMDRSAVTAGGNLFSAKLATEGPPSNRVGAPGSTFSVAKITGIAGPNDDIVIKHTDFILGDLVLPSTSHTFNLRQERDRNLTINGVISGPGALQIRRSGGFSDGVTPDELITITGTSPNTITGEIELYNDNADGGNFNDDGSPKTPQPSFWVADKVGAFGQTPKLTLRGRSGGNFSGIASLQFTANTIGGEGAIDDDATELYVGVFGVLSVDAGVNEVIGSGKMFIDLDGTGSFTTVADGVYDNSADWIIGDGTITVGSAIPEPSTFILATLGLLGLMGFRRRRRC